MFCRKCGNKMPEDSLFCPKCGVTVDVAVNNTPEDAYAGEIPLAKGSQSSYGYEIINGQRINVLEILQICNNEKTEAIKYLREITGIGFWEASKFIEATYKKYKITPATSTYIPLTKKGREKAEVADRIAKNKAQGVAHCPKCGSTSLSANKKGFGIGKAVVGAALTGGIGLVAGNIHARNVRVTCLNCGHSWKL